MPTNCKTYERNPLVLVILFKSCFAEVRKYRKATRRPLENTKYIVILYENTLVKIRFT